MSTLQMNHLVSSKLSPDTIVSFKLDSGLKSYVQLKTKITKTFYTFGEIIAILLSLIRDEKQYDERNPALIICSEELQLALKCKALLFKELKDAIINQLAFTQEYLGKGLVPQPSSKKSECFVTHIAMNKRAHFKLKGHFLELLQGTSRLNRNRTIYSYEDICALVCKYIRDRKDRFFHKQEIKVCWVQDDLLEKCFNVRAFHFVQLRALIWSQIGTCHVQTRRSPRIRNRNFFRNFRKFF